MQSGATADYVDNSVIVDVDAQMVAEVGTSYMQLQLSKDEKMYLHSISRYQLRKVRHK